MSFSRVRCRYLDEKKKPHANVVKKPATENKTGFFLTHKACMRIFTPIQQLDFFAHISFILL